MPDQAIRAQIRDRLARGALPRQNPAQTWGGYGTGALCAGCDLAILPMQAEYELEFPGGESVRFHSGCCAIWEVERRSAPG